MRVRLLLIAIALALVSVAAAARDDRTAPGCLRQGSHESGQLATQPPPQSDASATMNRATAASATVQSHLLPQSLGHLRPALRSLAVITHLPPVPHGTASPRFFPLLR